MSTKNLVVGVDLGTQSTKVLVYDPEARKVLAVSSTPHAIIQESDGTSEQEAQWWLDALDDCMKKLPAELRSQVSAIGVSGQQHGFVPLDAEGRPVYRAKLWNDTSTTRECKEITEAFGGRAALIAEVGNPMLPGYTAPKIRWLRNNRLYLYQKLSHILLPHDYLNYYLTGRYTMEAGDASGTGLLDVRKRCWSAAALRALDAERSLLPCLPELIEDWQCAGTVRDEIARRYELPDGVLVSAGGGDNMMAAIGTGCVTPGTFTVSLGTSGTVYAYSDHPIVDPDGVVAAFCSSTGGFLPLACTMNCTVATELNRNLFGIPVAQIDEMVGGVARGSDGLITLPFYSGERTPSLPNGRGCLIGLTPQNYTKPHLLRSAMEGALFALRYGMLAFGRLGADARQVRLTGGGSKSRIWRQLAADVFGCPVECPSVEETAALGGALQALWMLEQSQGKTSNIQSIVAEHVSSDGHTIQPNPDAVAFYAATYQTYSSYVDSLKPHFV